MDPECRDDQYERVCQAEFAEIKRMLRRIDVAMRGDEDNPGLLERVRMIERTDRLRRRVIWTLISAAGTAVAAALAVLGRALLAGGG